MDKGSNGLTLFFMALLMGVLLIGAVGCTPDNTNTVTTVTAVTTITATTSVSPIVITLVDGKMTRGQVSLLVHTRLTNLAQTAEAKEFVALYFQDAINYSVYYENEQAWTVGLAAGDVIGLITKAEWFKINDKDYFEDIVHSELKPTWIVYIDGSITPTGTGIIVESGLMVKILG